jgi:hypothetical protein
MSETRKGVFTPEQEKLLDDLIELKGLGEALDGPAISLIDNQGIDRLLEKVSDETKEVIYEVIDMVMDGIAAIVNK